MKLKIFVLYFRSKREYFRVFLIKKLVYCAHLENGNIAVTQFSGLQQAVFCPRGWRLIKFTKNNPYYLG